VTVYERFGVTPIPLYEAVQDMSTLPSSLPSTTMYGGSEYDHLGSERALALATGVSLRGEFLATDANDKTAQVLAWRARRGTRDRLVRTVDGTTAREWIWARLNRVVLSETPDTFLIVPFALDFKLYGNWWNGRRRGGGWLLDSGVALDSGYSLDMSDVTPLTPNGLTTIVLPNAGNATVNNAIVTITNPAGGTAITNLVLTAGPDASTVKASWTFAGTIAVNTSLVIDTGAQTVKNNGVAAYANFTWTASVIDDWLEMYVPSTTMKITLTGGGSGGNAATATVDYAEGFN
jgi:hypothetical protein